MTKQDSCCSDQTPESRGNVTLTVEWLLVPDRLVWVFHKPLPTVHGIFIHTQQSLEFTKNSGGGGSIKQPFHGRKPLVKERGQRRMAKLIWASRKATYSNNQATEQCYAEDQIRFHFCQLRTGILSHKGYRHQDWTTEHWKNVPNSDFCHKQGRI